MKGYTCGVPKGHCSGGEPVLSHHLRKPPLKVHNSSVEAFRCHARWLVNVEGYERVGNREFVDPNDGRILVLTKKSRFGGVLRQGKRVETSKKSKRLMPRQWTGGMIASY
jgi:hypothetical protein